MDRDKRQRAAQIAAGAGILAAVAGGFCLVLLFWRRVPGVFGEWLGFMAGWMSTPFLLEGSFLVMGFAIVIWLNHRRMRRDGDEFVYLEEVSGPELPEDLPDHARWAVYREEPLPASEPGLIELAEGAEAIGDHGEALALLARMDAGERRRPEVRMLEERVLAGVGGLAAVDELRFRAMARGDLPGMIGIARDFLEDLAARREKWSGLLVGRDFEALRFDLHSCKGAAMMLAMPRFVEWFRVREEPGRLEEGGFDPGELSFETALVGLVLTRLECAADES